MLHFINKIISRILIIPTAILTPIGTLLYAILTLITFGIYGKIIHWIKDKLIFIVIEFSKLYETNNLALQILSIFGLPFAALGSIIVSLVGYHGDFPRRARDIIIFKSFPFAKSFSDYAKNEIDLEDMESNTMKAIRDLINSPEAVSENIELYRENPLNGDKIIKW
ncbi:MAG: hypothetical protein IPM48_14285 [Saprospiraceae bacterium]|nr:hypothetical protein [Saprospiraceae bacterium]